MKKVETMQTAPVPAEMKRRSGLLDYEGKPIVSYDLSYPAFSLERELPRLYLENFYAYTAEQFEGRLKKTLFPKLVETYLKDGGSFSPRIASSSCVVSYNKGGLLSTYTDETVQSAGGVLLETVRSSATWDAKKGRYLPLHSVFYRSAKVRRTLLKLISHAIGRLQAEGAEFFPDCGERLDLNYYSENFFLGEQGFSVYFQPGELADASAGVETFTFPYAMLSDHLRRKL